MTNSRGIVINAPRAAIAKYVTMGYNEYVTSIEVHMENNAEMKKFLRGMGPNPETSYERAMRAAAEFRIRIERLKKNLEEEITIEEQNGIL